MILNILAGIAGWLFFHGADLGNDDSETPFVEPYPKYSAKDFVKDLNISRAEKKKFIKESDAFWSSTRLTKPDELDRLETITKEATLSRLQRMIRKWRP